MNAPMMYQAGEMVPPPRFTARDLLRILFRRKWVILICTAAVFSSVMIASQHMKPLYRAEATIEVEPWKQGGTLTISRLTQLEPEKQILTISELMRSRSVLGKVVTQMGLQDEILSRQPELTESAAMEQAINMLKGGRINIQGGANNIIRVTAIWENSPRAAQLANTLCDVFIDDRFEDQVRKAKLNSNYLQEELEKAEARLQKAEADLEKFKIENKMPNIGTRSQMLQDDLKKFEMTRRNLEVQLSTLDERVAVIRKKLEDMNRLDPDAGEHSEEANLIRQTIFSLEMELQALSKRYSDQHPDVVRKKADIHAQREKLNQIISTYVQAKSVGQQEERQMLFRQLREEDVTRADINRRINEIDQDIARVQSELAALPEKELVFRRLTRQYATAEAIQNALQSNLDAAERTLQLTKQEAATIRVLDQAILPRYPFYPNTTKNYFLGIVGGLAFALTVAFLLEFLNHSLESSEDVHQHIGLPVLGTVPVLTLK